MGGAYVYIYIGINHNFPGLRSIHVHQHVGGNDGELNHA